MGKNENFIRKLKEFKKNASITLPIEKMIFLAV